MLTSSPECGSIKGYQLGQSKCNNQRHLADTKWKCLQLQPSATGIPPLSTFSTSGPGKARSFTGLQKQNKTLLPSNVGSNRRKVWRIILCQVNIQSPLVFTAESRIPAQKHHCNIILSHLATSLPEIRTCKKRCDWKYYTTIYTGDSGGTGLHRLRSKPRGVLPHTPTHTHTPQMLRICYSVSLIRDFHSIL